MPINFFNLTDITTDNVHKTAGIAILNTHKLSASIDNNVLQNLKQFRYKTYAAGNEKYTGVWCSDWIYRGFNGEITELPWAKVVVTDDVNNDKLVDWQDGAIALRSLMPELDGAEKLRSSFFHLGMLYGSLTQFTFLRWLDDLKKINSYTDGFGQIFQIKGYQSEGHDAAHPDYGNNFNLKAGGLEDLNTLFSGAQKYNTDICLHINHSESYPEAKSYDPEIVSDIPAWRWWDQSYFIIREKDILNGTFKQRIKQLHEKVPALKFVYLDTYREERWIADYTAKLFHEMGWAIWTEDNYALDRYTSWVHYAPGGKSKISRFVHHQNRDAFQYDSLLLGGPESRNYRMSDVNGLVYSCMTHQLPYRYLMHFPLMKWTDTVALFGDDVMSVIEDNQTVIKKSDKVIVRGRDVFIPWSPKGESKIYHYNTSGTKSVWELPQSWTGLTEVMLYELTDLGRTFTRKIAVKDGKVELRVKNKTPYVIYKTKPDPMAPVDWGEGSLVKDMGFDSQGFGFWDKSANPASESQISIAKSENGNAHLHIAGGKAALVSQKLTGLQGGKTYSASVWAEVADGRKAVIGVMDYGAQEVTNFTDLGGVKNSINSQKRGDWHRLRVLFTVPEGKTGALLYLKAEQGNKGSFANFDDVRVMLYNRTLQKKHMFYEDFEHVDEGIYPFVPATDGTRVHLSEKHEGYTTDVLLDNFSLKISSSNRNGLMASTLPCNVRFQPNKKYTISFKYMVDLPDRYSIVVKSHRGGNKSAVMEEFLDTKGDFKHTITTGNHSDYYLAIYKHGKYSDSDLVIDNLSIDYR